MQIEIKCNAGTDGSVNELREFVCRISIKNSNKVENHLPEFNAILDKFANEMFRNGAHFERKHPGLL